MRVYIDESGNTGLEISDVKQPIYACAGIWIKPDDESSVSKMMDVARRKFNIQSKDIKGSDLILTRPGRKAIEFFTEKLVEVKSSVSLFIINKIFLASAWIVEDGLDHFYNPNVTARWTWPGAHKTDAAGRISQIVQESTLSAWWTARVKQNTSALQSVNNEVVAQLLADPGGADLGELLSGFDAGKCLSGEEKLTIDGMSPNVNAFNTMIQQINSLAAKLNASRLEIVHDKQRQFEGSFMHYAKLTINLEGKSKEPIVFPFPGGRSVTYGIDTIRNVRFEDSKKTLGLQLADCFAAVGRKVGEMALSTAQGGNKNQVDSSAIIQGLHRLKREKLLDWFLIGPPRWGDIASDLLTPRID